MSDWVERATLKILDFDIENRPLSYWTPDRPSAEVTAIAWSWIDKSFVDCALLGELDLPDVLEAFVKAYDEADVVTGHFIRRHDLPIVNGALIELGMKPLDRKLASDTRLDLMRLKDLPVSQEALAEYMGVKSPKIHMPQPAWREANRLTPEGLEKTRKRVVGDVKQHKEMRAELLRRGLLKPPKMWEP